MSSLTLNIATPKPNITLVICDNKGLAPPITPQISLVITPSMLVPDPTMTSDQLKKWKELCHMLDIKGWKIISTKYVDSKTNMTVICPKGHIRERVPSSIRNPRNKNGCGVCSGRCPKEAERKFRENAKRLGVTVIGNYTYANVPVHCLCINKHEWLVAPSSLEVAEGTCRKCQHNVSKEAEREFVEAVKEQGGRVVGTYVRGTDAVDCICINNHACSPRPTNIQQGQGICNKCADRCVIQAEAKFLKRASELGLTVVGKYIKARGYVSCICDKGHNCKVRPDSIDRSYPCRTCSKERIESFGAGNVRKYLTDNKIQFTTEETLPIINKVTRRFDFCFIRNTIVGNNLHQTKYIIEFDGMQHFKHCQFFGDEDHFDNIQIKDRTKSYCALISGYNVIHIHEEQYTKIKSFLDTVFTTPTKEATLFVDNRELYKCLLDVPMSIGDLTKSCGDSVIPNSTTDTNIQPVVLNRWLKQ